MNNLKIKIALKYAFILAGINLAIRIISPFIISENAGRSVLIISLLEYIAMIIIIVLAHNEFRKKNENDIIFKDAFHIGLIIIGIPIITLMIFNFIDFEFFIEQKVQSYYSSYFSSVVIQLLIQSVILLMAIKFEIEWRKAPSADTDIDNERRCTVCGNIVISKAMAVQTGNFNLSDRTCYNCGTVLCFGCASNEGLRRTGSRNSLVCPRCGANLKS
jgi:hypothetical protein